MNVNNLAIHKVLFMIDSFMDLNGAERNVMEIVTRLDQKKFISILSALEMRASLKEFIERKGIKAINLDIRKIYGFKALRRMIYIYRVIKNENIEIIVTYHNSSDIFGALIGKLAGVPVIISSRRDMGYNLKKRHVWFYKIVNRLCDQIITVSDEVKRTIVSRDGVSLSKIKTIYNGVDLNAFSNRSNNIFLKKELGIEPDDKVVGIIASIRHIKGHKIFLKSAREVLIKQPHTSFLVVGSIDDMDLYEELKMMIKEYGIEEKVIFTDERSDVSKILSIIDVSVLTSFSEGFSNTLIESMAMERPVVATNVGGNPEAVDNGETGFLVPPGDPEAVANAINILLDDEELSERMGNEARNKVERQFPMERMIRIIEDNFHELLQCKKR